MKKKSKGTHSLSLVLILTNNLLLHVSVRSKGNMYTDNLKDLDICIVLYRTCIMLPYHDHTELLGQWPIYAFQLYLESE